MAMNSLDSILTEFVSSDKDTISLTSENISVERSELIQRCCQLNLNVFTSSPNSVLIVKKDALKVLPLKISKFSHNTMRNFCYRSQYYHRNTLYHNQNDKRSNGSCSIRDERVQRGCRLQNSVGIVQKPSKYDESREMIPSYEQRKIILELIERSKIVMFAGESGTGKTTQIPQYILDQNIDCEVKIVCIEPDHISTVQAAEIVAQQRGEEVGFLVGYHIQLESRVSPHNCLVYITPDIFIQTFINNPSTLKTINYLLIDEIHLRNRYIDYILVALKEHFEIYPNLRLILLSASEHVDIYRNYFNNCEFLHIPTKGYQVQELFVDNVLEMATYQSNDMLELMFELDAMILRCMEDDRKEYFSQLYNIIVSGRMDVNYQERVHGYSPLMVAAARGNNELVTALLNLGANAFLQSWSGHNAYVHASMNHQFIAAKVIQNNIMTGTKPPFSMRNVLQNIYHQTVTDDIIDYNLILAIIKYIQSTSWDILAILVFLPSYDHVIDCVNFLAGFPIMTDLKIVTLHSGTVLETDHVLFQKCKERKVILSTTIAESSFHIRDVGYVIDSGRITFPKNAFSSGVTVGSLKWISRLAADQRKAKLSFQSNGQCFRLYTSQQYDAFNIANTSELLEYHLEDMCLRVRSLVPYFTIEEYFDKLVEPPPTTHVRRSINNLRLLGAIDHIQNLTALGDNLIQFFVEPYIAKLLIYGVFLKCLDPALTLAAILVYEDIFIEASDFTKLNAVRKVAKKFSYNSKSDHMALIVALTKFQEFKCERNEEAKCKQYCMLHGIAESILVVRASLLSHLRTLGFVSKGYHDNMHELNTFSEYFSILKAALAASLYPRIALRYETGFSARNELVSLHSTSCLIEDPQQMYPLGFIYQRFLRSNNVPKIKCVTAITPITVALFCGSRISYNHESQTLHLDKQAAIEIHSNKVWPFRTKLDSCLQKFFKNPLNRQSAIEESLLQSVFYVLNNEESEHKLTQPRGIGRRPLFFSFKTPQYTAPRYTNSYVADPSENSGNIASALGAYRFCSSSIEDVPVCEIDPKDDNKKTAVETGAGTFSNNTETEAASIQVRIVNEYFRMTFAEQAWGINNKKCDGMAKSTLKFYTIRPLERKNITMSMQQGMWNFNAQTEEKIFARHLSGDVVILLYNLRGTYTFQAVAQLKNIRSQDTISCPIEWIAHKDVNYTDIPNLNVDQRYIIEDGHEFPYELGLEIAYKIIHGEMRKTY